MVRSLHHRGPDANGAFSAEAYGKQLFLGHARLSIIDLTDAGRQPMLTADQRIALVFNGEIYNFQDLRARFCADYSFRSATDTEVLLALYKRMGLQCLQHLNGDFAVAILDQDRGKMLLIRDRVGVKPLYFWRSGDDLVFGSEIKALLAGGVAPVLATENLQRFFVFKYVPGNDTLFRGVHRLPPGHYLEYDLATGDIRVEAYWKPEFTTDQGIGYDGAKRAVTEIVEDATTLRLVSDVPVGNFLSGGLDSSIIASRIRDRGQIAHYCARQSAADVAKEGTTSDFTYAQRLANDWQLSFRPVDIGAAEVTLAQIALTGYFCDDLIADSAQVPTYLITRGAADSSRVFLSGMGADELFLGYAGHLLTLLDQYLGRVPGQAAIRDLLAGLAQGTGRFKSARRYLYRLGKYRGLACRFGIYSVVGDVDNAVSLVKGDRDALIEYLSGYFPVGVDPFDGLKRFEFDNVLQKNLAYTDRMAMANSVEVRVPFLDHRLVNLAYSLPRSYKLSGLGKSKRVLKDAYEDILPAYVTRRRKAGFGMPIRSIFSSRERVLGMLDMPLLAEAGSINVSSVQAVVESHVRGLEDNSSLIYALLSFQEWYKRFFT